jgi:hypothetical protein
MLTRISFTPNFGVKTDTLGVKAGQKMIQRTYHENLNRGEEEDLPFPTLQARSQRALLSLQV